MPAMHSNYLIDLRTIGDMYQIWILRGSVAAAVTREGQKVDFDRVALGLSRAKSARSAATTEPGLFSKEEAAFVAHKIGRYALKLGDLVYGYTLLNGSRDNGEFWSGPR